MLTFFRINTVPHRHAEATTWLELFFDLVYVAILIEMGNRLSHDLTLEGVLQFLFLFAIVWWSWLEKVLFARFFPNDDIGQRLLTVFYMAVMGVMAFNIHDMTGTGAVAFLLAYSASKVVLALMYAKAWKEYPEYRPMTRIYIGFFLIAAVSWLAIALTAPNNLLLWGLVALVGIVFQALLPWVHSNLKSFSFEIPPMKRHYMRHRFGELTIIVLGEFFIKVITSASDREVFPVTMLYFLLLLSISSSLWWLYFDHQEHSAVSKQRSRMESWVYIHYPLLAAITIYGVIGKKVMALVPGEALSDHKRLMLLLALAVAIACTVVIEWAAREKSGAMSRPPQTTIRLLGALALILLAVLGSGLAAPVLVAVAAGIIILLVGLDISWRLRTPLPDNSI